MTLRRGWLCFLLFALVAAQTVGLMHRVVHGAGAGSVSALSARLAHEGGRGAFQWAERLFEGHDDSGCLVLDQLGAGGVLPAPPQVQLPLVLPVFALQWFQGEVLARWAALFDARGPPSVR